MLVDVAINCYGKPCQTLLTIESLLEHSATLIDRIYLIVEPRQPRVDEDLTEVLRRHAQRLVLFTPEFYLGWADSPAADQLRRHPQLRRSVRYQYALEETDKRYLMLTHNDVIYSRDLLGTLLRVVQEGGHAGAGWVGQCWNCPACTAGKCDHDRQAELRLSYLQAVSLALRVPSPRTRPRTIHLRHPVPLPECRLNEFACILDVDVYRRETLPTGSSPPFGSFSLDVGCAWFRAMVLKGHTFGNVDINEFCCHEAGHPDLFDPGAYERKESRARAILAERYGLHSLPGQRGRRM